MTSNVNDADQSAVAFGDFRLDFDLRCAYRADEKLKISPIPFNTLEFLVRNRHRVVSKSELLEAVWGGQRDPSTVEHAISQLRRALGADSSGQEYIETVTGHGYRFVPEIVTSIQSTGNVVPAGIGPWSVLRVWPFLWAGAVLLASLAIIGVITWFHEPQISSATAIGDSLTAKDASGNVLWTHRFGYRFMEGPDEAKSRIQVVDLNGDGQLEVLVATALADPTAAYGPEELLCFSSRGKLLWHYRPQIDMEFNTPDLNGPWRIAQMIIVGEGSSKSIWLAVDHAVWWPAFIRRISPDGSGETMFISSGAIYGLMSLLTKSGAYILAGGINNEYRTASMAVLAVTGTPATSPQGDGSKFQCIRGCPAGKPYRYLLLPRSEANIASDIPYNDASQIFLRPGGFTIRTREVEAAAQFFDFTEAFEPKRVVYSGDYPDRHRRYEREGRITHSFDLCPERRNPAVVEIFDEKGTSRLQSVPRMQ
jgi:DNA-binding winged helix-turn-helix (wHTH) protein